MRWCASETHNLKISAGGSLMSFMPRRLLWKPSARVRAPQSATHPYELNRRIATNPRTCKPGISRQIPRPRSQQIAQQAHM